ncbi:MAG: COX15/CtaA family protein [Actinomycetales bacterium]|nr:COX15/CtaA family protein [Actinomycetales bacterium]
MTPMAAPGGTRVPRPVTVVLLVNLIAQAGIIVTGGLVRLTGSGLGCPTWPECAPGSLLPTAAQAEGVTKFIEFGNRLLTFAVAAAALATVIVLWRLRPRPRGLRALSAIPLIGTVGQAVLGGITVLTGLNPLTVMAHLLLSLVLVAVSVVLLLWVHDPPTAPGVGHAHVVRAMAGGLFIAGAVVVTLGAIVTGSGPHAGDETAARFGFDIRAVAWLHADSVWLYLGLLIGLLAVLTVTAAPLTVRRTTWLLLAVSLAQGLVGYVQWFTGLPWLLVAVHLLGAVLVWIGTTAVAYRVLRAFPARRTTAAASASAPAGAR